MNPVDGDDPIGSEYRADGATDMAVDVGNRSVIAGREPSHLTGDIDSPEDPSTSTGDLAISVPLRFVVAERPAGLRPPRFDLTYSHVMPRAMHFEQEGFCLWHLTLDAAHATQLSRSLGTGEAVSGRDMLDADDLIAGVVVDRDVSMMLNKMKHKKSGTTNLSAMSCIFLEQSPRLLIYSSRIYFGN